MAQSLKLGGSALRALSGRALVVGRPMLFVAARHSGPNSVLHQTDRPASILVGACKNGFERSETSSCS